MRSVIKHICTIALTLVCAVFLLTSPCEAGKYDKKLSESQKASLCSQLQSQQLEPMKGNKSLGGGIIPDSVFTKIYATTKNINDKVAILLTLGHSLTCHAVHAGKHVVSIAGVQLFDYPDFSVWLCGAIIYMVGFMMTISISFYVADIAFKLGFAIIMLPIGIALWPFPLTKDKLSQIISIMLKNAAIFVFLAITVSYALNLVDAALNTNLADETPQGSSLFSHLKTVMAAAQSGLDWDKANGMQKLFFAINNNMTDIISENFVLFSSYFLVMLCALIYGFKLVGSTIPDYVDKFFPDKAFGGGMAASPMHNMMTQGMDFVKKNTVDKAASWAGDVVKTQTGRAMAGVGNLVSGKYNGQIKNYWNNPGNITQDMANAVHNTGATVAKSVSSVIMGTAGRIVLGQQASQDLHNKLSEKIDKGASYLDEKAANVAQNINKNAHERQEQRQQRREERKEQFDNSKLGQKVNKLTTSFDNSAIGKGVNKSANFIKKAVKSGINLTGEVLAKTGEKMQQNYKSPEDLAQEEAEKLADWEHEQEERRKRGEEY